ncbi:hypothetical protein [Liquorilactobacillus hordei]|uniref:Uncharacterized protein n=1 Tax=Liquorilactobacillus hordei DSM 19519 TaxID=1423759 RepID=A0A0R1MSC0_9LACO|nr:hypothetical protein [Liquorilactobacillus hordei]KRL08037.1 hypothetical protein FC92_GL001110 [Liquorilactobacillus hordei DSM 19519]QYH51019.1 hypothetical protein G6O70_00190 [Liquorilactobacillus hordei DSM 19519]
MKKIIDLTKIESLLNSAISATEIEKETNIEQDIILNYRNNTSELENMTIANAFKLQNFYDKHNVEPTISCDSTELIEELKIDIEGFGDFECWAWFKKIEGAKIYTNYDFKEAESPLTKYEINQAKENGEQFEILKAKHLLELLERQNKIL